VIERLYQPATWVAGIYFKDTDEWASGAWIMESELVENLDTCTNIDIYLDTHMKLISVIEIDGVIERMMQ